MVLKIIAAAQNWLTVWGNRKSKLISGSTGGAQTNYTMTFTVNKGSGVDTPTSIFLNNKCNDDFSDIRFTNSDGSTPLSYWIETFTSGVSATVWVTVDTIPVSPNTTTIYIYYNNPTATSESSGDNTFPFFDDFPGTSLDNNKWSQTYRGTLGAGSSISVSNGNAVLTRDGTVNSIAYVQSILGFGTNYSINSRSKLNVIPGVNSHTTDFGGFVDRHAGTNDADGGAKAARTIIFGNTRYTQTLNVAQTLIGYSSTPTDYNKYKASRNGSTQVIFYLNGTITNTHTTNIPTVTLFVDLKVGNQGATFDPNPLTISYDWIFVNKYINPEPAFSTTGSEENKPAPSATLILGSLFTPTNRGITLPTGRTLGKRKLRNR